MNSKIFSMKFAVIIALFSLGSQISANAQQVNSVAQLSSYFADQGNTFIGEDIFLQKAGLKATPSDTPSYWKTGKVDLQETLNSLFNENNLQGNSSHQFALLIDAEGEILEIKLLTSTDKSAGDSILELMNDLSWVPAMENGEPVKSIRRLGVSLRGGQVKVDY